ncbi:MAG: adenosylcobinamide-GDP ribazoletransferase [Eubacteriales bacterium]
MKKLLESFVAAFSMYSRIPMPHILWSEDSMKYAMCFFPLVGAVIGALEYLWFMPYRYGHIGVILYAAVAVVIPVLISGGIHLDGFLDTADALSSWREKEERLRILKDSHVGAYAVIWACVLFILAFGAASEIRAENIMPLCLIFMLSRTFSAFAVVSGLFPKANPDGTLAVFSDNAAKKTVRIVCVIYLIVISLLLWFSGRLTGMAVLAAGMLAFLLYRHVSLKYFGGTTGDLAGFFVTYSELLMLAAGVLITL